MIEKPEQYYDTRRHQLYYQWRESEHYIHQEPIYDRTRDYIESLEAENAKLRSQCADLVDERERLFQANVEKNGEILRLVDENAKLQKLAHDLLQPILADGFDCYGCVHEDCDGMRYTDRCKLLDRARELGVEVDG